MRTVQVGEFGGQEVLRVTEVDAPAAGPGHVTVDVSVVPVLFLDTQIRSGAARDRFPARPPYVPGAGVAGEVSSVVEGVDPTWVGREIVASGMSGGAYSECVVVAVDDLIVVPEGLTLTDAGRAAPSWPNRGQPARAG